MQAQLHRGVGMVWGVLGLEELWGWRDAGTRYGEMEGCGDQLWRWREDGNQPWVTGGLRDLLRGLTALGISHPQV